MKLMRLLLLQRLPLSNQRNFQLSIFKVWVNEVNRCDKAKDSTTKLSVQLTIDEVFIHGGFEHIENSLVDDMVVRDAALIRVKEPISHIATLRSVCLPKKSDWSRVFKNEEGQISGWGQLSREQRGEASCELQVGRIRVTSAKDARGCKARKSRSFE